MEKEAKTTLLSEQDLKTIQLIRDDNEALISRNRLVKAFKNAGSKVTSDHGRLTIWYEGSQNYKVPLGHGDVDLGTVHHTFRQTLRNFATELLERNSI